MKIDRADLDEAVTQQILAPPQAEALWRYLEGRPESSRRFTGLNVGYYLGALIVIAAMGWLMTRGFERMGPWAVCLTAVAYAAAFVAAGDRLWKKAETKMPGGLLYAMAVCMTPLAIWGLEKATGFWLAGDPGAARGFHPYVRASWVWMEAFTVLAALVALRRIRFPFLVAPAAVSLWYMSMDLAAALSRSREWETALGQKVSIVFGLCMLFVAYLVDQRTREDFAFWLYLFGLTALWGALTSMDSSSEWRRAQYCLLNLGFVCAGVFLTRRVFVVYGALGVNLYLAHLAWEVFQDSLLFPFALTLLGLSLMGATIAVQRNRLLIDAWVQSIVPEALRAFMPRARRAS